MFFPRFLLHLSLFCVLCVLYVFCLLFRKGSHSVTCVLCVLCVFCVSCLLCSIKSHSRDSFRGLQSLVLLLPPPSVPTPSLVLKAASNQLRGPNFSAITPLSKFIISLNLHLEVIGPPIRPSVSSLLAFYVQLVSAL